MKKLSPIILKLALIVVGAIVLLLCVFSVPKIGPGLLVDYPAFANLKYLVFISMYGSAVALFSIIYKSFVLLRSVDKGNVFSNASVQVLKNIKYSFSIISGLLFISMPIMYHIADYEDAPGIIIVGLMIVAIPIVIASFVDVLQRLLQHSTHKKQ